MNNMFEKWALRKMFGQWREEVVGCSRKFLSEEFLIFIARQAVLM
jgi:hypothetical protein